MGPAFNLLIELAAGTPGRLVLAKGALDLWNNYNRARELESLQEFMGYLAEQIGDVQQLLSAPYLKTPEGQRFANKIVAAAVDSTLAEKRRLFANALISGIRGDELGELDRLRFVDLITQLSAASLVQLAEIHKRCEPALAKHGSDSAWESVSIYPDGIPLPNQKPGAGPEVHFAAATLRELKSSGVLGKVRYGRGQDGALKTISASTEANYYNAFTRAFCQFISPATP